MAYADLREEQRRIVDRAMDAGVYEIRGGSPEFETYASMRGYEYLRKDGRLYRIETGHVDEGGLETFVDSFPQIVGVVAGLALVVVAIAGSKLPGAD